MNTGHIYSNRALLTAFVCVFATIIGSVSANIEQPKEMVVLRYDDYSAKSPIAVDRKIVDILKKHHVKAVFAVIPFTCAGDHNDLRPQRLLWLTPEKVKLLKDAINAGVVEVALHGYIHQTIHPRKRHSEFAGEKYDKQLSKIRKGKQYLENVLGVSINSFVPPWNSYDENTLRALKATGIRMLSADKFGPACEGLQYIPFTSYLQGLRAGVEDVLKAQNCGTIIVPLFHSYDFNESNDPQATMTIEQFDDIVSWLSSRDDVETSTFSGISTSDLSIKRYEANRHWPNLARFLPMRFLINSRIVGGYMTISDINSGYRKIIWMVIGLYTGLIVIGVSVGLLSARFIRFSPWYTGILLLLLLIVIFVKMYSSGFGPSSGCVSAFAMAYVSGLLLRRLRRVRKDV